MLVFKIEHDSHPSFSELSPVEQARLMLWIKKSIKPRSNPYFDFSHVYLCDRLETETDLRLPYDTFAEAMALSGYYPVDPDSLHWHFRISAQSPVFVRAWYKRGAYYDDIMLNRNRFNRNNIIERRKHDRTETPEADI